MIQKYIIIDNIKPVIFDITLQHSQIAGNLNITSAGFLENGKCFGRSDSLNIESKPTDSYIIHNFIFALASLKDEKDH